MLRNKKPYLEIKVRVQGLEQYFPSNLVQLDPKCPERIPEWNIFISLFIVPSPLIFYLKSKSTLHCCHSMEFIVMNLSISIQYSILSKTFIKSNELVDRCFLAYLFCYHSFDVGEAKIYFLLLRKIAVTFTRPHSSFWFSLWCNQLFMNSRLN